MVGQLQDIFPRLALQITSPKSNTYNCVAWAAGDVTQWWWPVPEIKEVYWPPVSRVESLASFQEAFTYIGYTCCDGQDLETDFDKIAVFANDQGMPTHAARQLPSGRWSSKLGELEDIEHDLRDLEGQA